MAYAKIGFHCGTGGNRTGIGDYFQRLDAAGIPFCIKSTNDVGLVVEAAQYARRSGVPHNIILRFTNPGGAANDLPDFNLPPGNAAEEHWNRVLASLTGAPEFEPYKDLIWIEPTNEIDTHTQADFLGWFSFHLGQIANAQGYKVALSGHNAGQPEPEHWRRPGFKAFLEDCARRPDKLAVSLHEGKLGDMNAHPDTFFPHLIGRFTWLYDICDAYYLIARPTTFITEWAWAYNNMPDLEAAMQDVKWLAILLAKYPTLQGAFLWNLGGGTQWADLPNKLQRLIGPITSLSLSTVYPDPQPVPPPDPGIGKIVYILKPTNLTSTEDVVVNGWAKNGVLLPNGSKTDGFHTLAFSHTDAIRNVAAGNEASLLLVVEGNRIGDGLDQAWLDKNAPEVANRAVFLAINPAPIPVPLGDPKIGLHASSEPAITEAEFQEFRDLKPEVITVLSGLHSPNDINRLAAEHLNAELVVRIFFNFGGRNISPQQFVQDNLHELGIVLGFIGHRNPIIQIHNEPNLYDEGLGSSWLNGSGFNTWYLNVLSLLRQSYPGRRFGYPGLSPGGSIPGIRLDSAIFLRDCADAVNASNVLCVHSYFAPQTGISLDVAVNEVAAISKLFPNKDIYITEAANNKGNVLPEQKANEYVLFIDKLRHVPKVKGVTYFVASTARAEWNWTVGTGQSWLPVRMATRVRTILDRQGV